MCGHDSRNDPSATTGEALDGHRIDGQSIDGHPKADQLASVSIDGSSIDGGGIGGCANTQVQLPPAADVGNLLDRLRSAEGEVAQLKVALESQRLIGVAVGLLAHRFRCSPEQSWGLMVRLSQTSNVKAREIARILVDAHCGRSVAADAELLAMLAAQLPGDGQEVREATPRDGSERDS